MIGTPYDFIADRFRATRTHFRPGETDYLNLVLDGLAAKSTLLDLGCGTGTPIAAEIILRGHSVVGVDGSEAMLALAREQFPQQRWIHGSMEQVEFEETFAGAVCWDSLFHLPRQIYPPVLAKIHRWLAPGARLMISSGGLAEENDNGKGFTDTMFGREFFYDSPPPKRMVELLEATGFKILRAEMCDLPDGGRNKGKWATVASRI